MTELQKITTEVRPTSLNDPTTTNAEVTYNQLLKDIIPILGLRSEECRSLDEGIFSERNRVSNLSKILIDLLVLILDQDDPKIENTGELSIHKQNKKFVKDSLILLLNNLKNYSIDDKKVKLLLVGKLIQSLYESKG